MGVVNDKHIPAWMKGTKGPKCPYCGSDSYLRSDEIVYRGKSYGGMVYVCENFPRCDAFVGTHKDKTPLGTLANKKLRDARVQAHEAFDPLWKNKPARFVRKVAYMYLASMMGMNVGDCHIGSMNEDQCKQVVEFSEELATMAENLNFRVITTNNRRISQWK